jgi:hypothetical protein
MDILSDPLLIIVSLVVWVALIGVAVRTFDLGDEKPATPFRSTRDILEQHLARQDIGREEYVDRRKALDYMSQIV